MRVKNKKMLILIYVLILVAIIAIVFLTKIVLDNVKKEPTFEEEREVTTVDVNPYPVVNDECTFNVTLGEYHALESAGCVGGYTKYDIALDDLPLKITVLYSDQEESKAGIFVNDVRITSEVSDIAKIKFGIFDKKLFIFDKTDGKANVYSVNSKGDLIYNLKDVLNKKKIKEFATGDKNISTADLDSNSFNFYEGGFEFNSKLDSCENNSKGSHYKVTYTKEKFKKPEFMNLIDC